MSAISFWPPCDQLTVLRHRVYAVVESCSFHTHRGDLCTHSNHSKYNLEKENIIMYQTVWSYAKRKIYAILVVSYKTTFCVIDMIQWSMMTSSNENIFRVTGLLCWDSPTTGEFPAQRPVTRSYDVFFDLRLNQQLSKQWSRRWFKTPPRSL